MTPAQPDHVETSREPSTRDDAGSAAGDDRVKSRREARGLFLLFGAMYFIQGIAEPTEGLVSQPVRSLLKSWDYSATRITAFMALLALPWSLKPLYGLLTDFVPIAGTRRRSYLILTTATAAAGLAWLYVFPVAHGGYWMLFALLILPTLGVAFSDVVVDALMVERGQPLGLTGRLQSVQWACIYAGSIVAGFVGGWLSEHGRQREGFLVCAGTSGLALVLAIVFVREERSPRPRGQFAFAVRELLGAARTPAVLSAAAFLFLWNFNPFSSTVLYLHMTDHLGIGEQFYGTTISLLSVGAVVGSLAYATYCRRVRTSQLVHLAIAAGVASTLAYAWVTGPTSLAVTSVIVGFAYVTGTLVQLDLAARACPIATAGTTFALLMALSNFATSSSTALGGRLYDDWSELWGRDRAFQLLVVAGAVATSACWALLPLLVRTTAEQPGEATPP